MAELSGPALTRLTIVNTGLLVVNTLLLVGLLLRGGSDTEVSTAPVTAPAPLDVPAGSTAPPMSTAPAGLSLDGVGDFLEATASPLADAAGDHGVEAGEVLPSEDAIAAAIASDRLDSPETLAVIATLKEGYAKFNMPFPEVQIPAAPAAEPTPSEPGAPSEVDQGSEIEAWVAPTIAHLQEVLAEKGESEAGLIPTEDEIAAAVSSGRFDSDESRWVIDMLKNGYARFDLAFPEPGAVSTPSAPQPTTRAVSTGEQEVLRAYFEANTQRLKLMASKQGISVDDVLPEPSVVEAAVASGDISSEAAQPALDQLRSGYERVGQEFREPVVAP